MQLQRFEHDLPLRSNRWAIQLPLQSICEGTACMAYEVMRRPKGGGMLIEHSIRDGNTKQAGNKTEKTLELQRFDIEI